MSLSTKQIYFKGNWYNIDNYNQEYVLIKGLCIGESQIYGYDTFEGNINDIMYKASQINEIVTIVFDNINSKGFVKKGFNLLDVNDISINPDFTTFIKINKIPLFYNDKIIIVPDTVPQVVPNTNTTTTKDRITKRGTELFVGNSNTKFIPVGFNAYYLGLMEDGSYPSNDVIEEIFKDAVNLKASVIRSHTLGFSSGRSNTLLKDDYTINTNGDAWRPIDYSYLMAEKYNIKLVCPLTDNYWYYHGNYNDYCTKYNIDKKQFFTDSRTIADFKMYIKSYLEHVNQFNGIKIKDNSALFTIELGNELGNIRNDTNSIPPKKWIQDISGFIKSISKDILISSGSDECIGSNISDDYSITNIDVISPHFYSEDYNRVQDVYNRTMSCGKSFFIGEYSSKFSQDWFEFLANKKYPGIFWLLYPQNYTHDDGYTIHVYDQVEISRIQDYHTKINRQ